MTLPHDYNGWNTHPKIVFDPPIYNPLINPVVRFIYIYISLGIDIDVCMYMCMHTSTYICIHNGWNTHPKIVFDPPIYNPLINPVVRLIYICMYILPVEV
jgi:hypothetical protein